MIELRLDRVGNPGEERLREHITNLYGNLVFYDGRPSQAQVEAADALTRELADVVREFDAWAGAGGGLVGLNAALTRKRLEPISLLTRAQWEAQTAAR